MKKVFVSLFLFAPVTFCLGQGKDVKLEKKILELVRPFHGNVGLYVKNLRNGKIVAIKADTLFPTASLVKVPILIGIMDKINRGELNYHQEIIYNDSLLYPGVDILGSFKNGEKIELSKLMMLMMTMSDNTASRYLQMLAGTGTRINRILDSIGFDNTRVNSKTEGREGDREKFGWGQTTPREMATLLEKIYRSEIISTSACTRMLRVMNRNYWDEAGVSQVPPNAAIFSKNGALEEYRSEVMLVRGYRNEYVVCIITNNNEDKSWTYNNEAWTLIRKVSNLLWNWFEPGHRWEGEVVSGKW